MLKERKGGNDTSARVHQCQEALLWSPSNRACSGGEDRREILKFGPKAEGVGGIEEGGTDPLLMIGASPLLNPAWHTV